MCKNPTISPANPIYLTAHLDENMFFKDKSTTYHQCAKVVRVSAAFFHLYYGASLTGLYDDIIYLFPYFSITALLLRLSYEDSREIKRLNDVAEGIKSKPRHTPYYYLYAAFFRSLVAGFHISVGLYLSDVYSNNTFIISYTSIAILLLCLVYEDYREIKRQGYENIGEYICWMVVFSVLASMTVLQGLRDSNWLFTSIFNFLFGGVYAINVLLDTREKIAQNLAYTKINSDSQTTVDKDVEKGPDAKLETEKTSLMCSNID